MTRLIRILFLLASLVTAAGCYKDKSNNAFKDKEVITIKGIAPSYDKISLVDSIIINPEVTSSEDGSFAYFWGIYETNVQGSVPKVDTIARTKEIRYLVVQP